MFYILLLLLFVFILLSIALYLTIDKKIRYKNLNGKHVVITGGSSGIGKAAAVTAASYGADVTIIGRDVEKLQAALVEIKAKCKAPDTQKIQFTSLNVTAGYDVIAKCLASLEEKIGPIFMLINCAGNCICGQFETMEVEDIKQMVDLNYFGTAYPIKYVLPSMKKRKEGIIVMVSTEAALLGKYAN